MDHPHWHACVKIFLKYVVLYAKLLGVHCNEKDAVSSWTEVYIQMLSLQTWRLSFLEGVDFINCDLTSNPPTAFKKKKKKSIVQPALLEELVAGERDGNRSWNTPSGFCSMRCNSSCLSVCLSEHMLTFSYKRDMVVFFINWTSVIALSEHIFTQFYQITLCQ